jgi:hypothetical protein
MESRIDFEPADLSVLSVEVLDSLLLNESISVESEDALLRFILKLGPGYRDLLMQIEIEFLSEDALSPLDEDLGIPPESLWECAAERIAHSSLDSRIISGFPEIFAEFEKKRFSLLWRGSCDGFKAQEFHGRCDGHANTLTVIVDTKGNILGGFTLVEWGSWEWNRQYGDKNNCLKADNSQKSFVFTLKNPHNMPAMRFALNDEEKWRAIHCDSEWFPDFNDIVIGDDCSANTSSFTLLGSAYTNETGLDGCIVFTSSRNFQVKEIEVFEITD